MKSIYGYLWNEDLRRLWWRAGWSTLIEVNVPHPTVFTVYRDVYTGNSTLVWRNGHPWGRKYLRLRGRKENHENFATFTAENLICRSHCFLTRSSQSLPILFYSKSYTNISRSLEDWPGNLHVNRLHINNALEFFKIENIYG